MTLTRRARELVLVAALLALAVLLLRANAKSPGDLNWVDRLILRAASPVERVITWAGRGVSGVWRRYVFLVGVQEDRERIEAENRVLRGEVARFRAESQRLRSLEQLVELRARVPAETVVARVVGVETSSFFRVIRVRLDRGEDAVRVGMPVLAPEGLVGRIQRVYGGYSDVLLATDPKSAVDVVLPRTGARGVLKGVTGEQSYRMRIEYLLQRDEVVVGDAVVSSGIGAFPRDVPVGKVISVKRANSALYQDAEVEPAVPFGKLSDVIVILSAPPPPDTDAGHRAEPVRGLGAPR